MISPINSILINKIKNSVDFKKNFQTSPIKSIDNKNANYNQINFSGYRDFQKPMTFEQTVEDNYFHLPIVEQDGKKVPLKPDDSQLKCAKYLYEGKSVVFDAPTGMGKTAIAHYSMAKNLKEGKKTIYTVPIKALANDKYSEFVKIYGENNVGLLTGDMKINPEAPIVIMVTEILENQSIHFIKKEADKIGTIVYDEAHYIGDYERGGAWEYSIINTVPLGIQSLFLSATIGNPEEFTKWISNISTREVKRVNVEQEDRPVPLLWNLYKDGKIVRIVDGKVELDTELNDNKKRALEILYGKQDENSSEEDYENLYSRFKEELSKLKSETSFDTSVFKRILIGMFPDFEETELELVSQLMSSKGTKEVNPIYSQYNKEDYIALVEKLEEENMLPAIVFKLSQNGCERVAEKLLHGKRKDSSEENEENQLSGIDLLNEREKQEVQNIINKYQQEGIYIGRNINKDMLLRGFAVHHAGKLPHYKKLIEELFSKKLIKVVISTSTLGAGINMPAKTVVLSGATYGKYDVKEQKMVRVPLTANEFHQMAGRAGRRGIDKIGNVVLYNLPTGSKESFNSELSDKTNDELMLAYDLIESDPNDLRSSFRPQATMLAQYYKTHDNNDALPELVDSTFKIFLSKDPERDKRTMLRKFDNYQKALVKQGFIKQDSKNRISLTSKGDFLALTQGVNPLALASIMHDTDLSFATPEQLCQIAGQIAGSSENQKGQFEKFALDKVVYISTLFPDAKINSADYEKIRDMYIETEKKVNKTLREARININDIKRMDDFSGMFMFLFASLNKKQPSDYYTHFELLTDSKVNEQIPSGPQAKKSCNKQLTKGNAYKIVAASISTLKQMYSICDYAINHDETYTDTRYWENLQEKIKESIQLIERM